jgi:prevent-host-death family protein
MKTFSLADAKTNFSALIQDVEAGNDVAITNGKKKETIAIVIPYEKWKKNRKRQLGILEGKMSVVFADEFAITDKELFNI